MGKDAVEVRRFVAKIGLLAAMLALLFAVAAQAAENPFVPQDNSHPTPNDGWQAGTCTTDTPTCSVATPGQFYETAAGHPPVGFTQIIVKHKGIEIPLVGTTEEPLVDLDTLRVDLPIGLSVNPGATPRCDLAAGAHPDASGCPATTEVGKSFVTVTPEVLGLPITIPASVYNLKPKEGQPARFGFSVPNPVLVAPPSDIYLEADVAYDSDFHEGFTIDVPKVAGVRLLKNRLVFNGRAHGPDSVGFFLTNPSTCLDPNQPAFAHTYATYARGDSLQNKDSDFPNGSPFVESPLPPGTSPKDCASIPFKPGLHLGAGTNQVDSPAGATTEVTLPVVEDPTAQENSTMRSARVTLPLGMGLNPSAANGLQACTDAQFGKGTRNPIACPAASKIGTTTVVTPPLPEGPLTGNVYVGTQDSRDPESGQEFRIFVDAASSRYGVDVRLIGNVVANSKTGQLTAVFDEPAKQVTRGGNSDNLPSGLPQVPFTTFRISIDGGPKAALTSPGTCGPNKATSQLTPWSGNAPATPGSEFTLAKAPGGGDCPKTLGERPFSPGFSAKPKSSEAAAFTPFSTRITRGPGQQELKGIDVTLPEGATAKLKGVPYCPPDAIAAAANRSGADEKKNSSCPGDSKIGVATVEAGSGDPLKIEGNAYLAGPYQGAKLSAVVVTPALAGPFDLGTVVVRVPFFLDPETAQIHPKTDALPDVYGGTKLDLRSIFLNINRKDFTLNGTNCRKGATAGSIKGGGGDPTNPAAFSSVNVSDEFQATGCDKLKFRPKLKIRLFGATRRAKNPKLRAVLTARPGDANIARASVGLPHALFLDQASLATICTRVQFAAGNCPKKSIYGRARAFTPLLGKPLEGPVYLRSSDNPLPDMVAHLEGQVDIDLVGKIDSFKGGIRTTFGRVPDVPVEKFVMTLPGGKHGLLVNSTNLCAKPVKAVIRFTAQNGKKLKPKPRKNKLRTPCKKQKRKHSRHHKK
ncbi:MAG TPA: hypothetical protein VFJ61_12055 [Solirubrobacterales bacterium]|nr:hypothetical protein [Solirubrobacterales bacterium]